jgi:hypothetical protein
MDAAERRRDRLKSAANVIGFVLLGWAMLSGLNSCLIREPDPGQDCHYGAAADPNSYTTGDPHLNWLLADAASCGHART